MIDAFVVKASRNRWGPELALPSDLGQQSAVALSLLYLGLCRLFGLVVSCPEVRFRQRGRDRWVKGARNTIGP